MGRCSQSLSWQYWIMQITDAIPVSRCIHWLDTWSWNLIWEKELSQKPLRQVSLQDMGQHLGFTFIKQNQQHLGLEDIQFGPFRQIKVSPNTLEERVHATGQIHLLTSQSDRCIYHTQLNNGFQIFSTILRGKNTERKTRKVQKFQYLLITQIWLVFNMLLYQTALSSHTCECKTCNRSQALF